MELVDQLKLLGIEYVDEMFDTFQTSALVHAQDPFAVQGASNKVQFGSFLFFLRSIMIRHTQDQTYRFTSTKIMSLPSKVSVFTVIVRRQAFKNGTNTCGMLSIAAFFLHRGNAWSK
jgi:hypothetical protein